MFSMYHLHITQSHGAMLGVLGTIFQNATTFASQVTGCQVCAKEKATRPLLQKESLFVTEF